MGKILVTGASGTVGSQLVDELLDAGAEVRVALRDPAKGSRWADKGAEVIAFDWDKDEDYAKAMDGVERAFLLTPFVEIFVPWVEKAVNAAKGAGVKHVVRMSAIGADPNAPGVGKDHGQAEQMVKESGMGWTVLQPTFFADNAVNYQLPSIQAQGSLYVASAGKPVSYVSTGDIAAVAAKVLLDPAAHDEKTWVLTGPEAIPDADLAKIVSEIRGQAVQAVDLPLDQYEAGLRQQGTPEWMTEHLVFFENIKAQGWGAEVSPAVEQILGRPAQPAPVALKRYADALKA